MIGRSTSGCAAAVQSTQILIGASNQAGSPSYAGGVTLTVGFGALGHQPRARFNVELPPLEGLFFVEPYLRRIRGIAEGETIVDSRRVEIIHEHGRLPTFLFPRDDVRSELLEPSDRTSSSENKGETRWFHLRIGDGLRENAVFEYASPPPSASMLEGLIGIEWGSMDEWLEEDEQAIVHARDPYHRVDVLDTSRHVRVSVGGETVAETTRARVLFETGLPPRWYISREDIRGETLVEGGKRTGCAYKGFADHLSVRTSAGTEEDIAWTYPDPRRDAGPVKDRIAFYNERVDLEIDGELEERPMTPFHPDFKGRPPEEGEGRPTGAAD
jgi:uncharacterized protein (DUF427 family)